MKPLLSFISFFLFASLAYSQNKGSVILNNIKAKGGIENWYTYRPRLKLIIQDKPEALFLYLRNGERCYKTVPLTKINNEYKFSFTPPDSVGVIIIGIVDGKKTENPWAGLMGARKNVIDNNNGSGYIFYVNQNEKQEAVKSNLALAWLLHNVAPYQLDMEPNLKQISDLYRSVYSIHQNLKENEEYPDYLEVLFKLEGEAVKPRLLAYALKMQSIKGDESKWRKALTIYKVLDMEEEQKQINKQISSAITNEIKAERKFWDYFYSQKERTGESIIASMKEYIAQFKDSSSAITDLFHSALSSYFFNKKDWASFYKYEELITNIQSRAYSYNKSALSLAGKQITDSGSYLEIAKDLSKKSLVFTETKIKKSDDRDKKNGLLEEKVLYLNTYAQILFKMGIYDSAFYYQDSLYRQNDLFASGLEKYAVYAEKVKGVKYAQEILEKELLSGINSPAMLKQLQSIYSNLNLPENQFENLKERSLILSRKTNADKIISEFGTLKAKDFQLKNTNGQTVALSSFHGKVVVLDFWATWCGPCRASFPAMQQAVNKYKADTSVVFLFIDTWEHGNPEKIKINAASIMKAGNYSFNILLDINDQVVRDYKVKAIPQKFIINKQGDIAAMDDGNGVGDIYKLIEDAKR